MAEKRARPGEFELIARYFRPLARTRGAIGLADDAALFRPRAGNDLVITADTIAEGVHFFHDDPADSVARKALRVNLSDLAAKGAVPSAYLLSLSLPGNWTEAWVGAFARGLKADQSRYDISLIGGDTIKAAGRVTVAVTALGHVPRGRMVLRSGARPGDAVFVTGTIGDAALGLRLRQAKITAPDGGKGLLRRFLHPEPRLGLAPVLRRHASSAIDVSDGLVVDLNHICEVSAVGAEIGSHLIPLSAAARRLIAMEPSAFSAVLNGGDDYEILATVAAAAAGGFARDARDAGIAVTRIGRIMAGKGPPVVKDATGRTIRVSRHGHTHF